MPTTRRYALKTSWRCTLDGTEVEFIGIGGAALDLVLQLPRRPGPDEKIVASSARWMSGGLVANATCAASRLGLSVKWLGAVGEDFGGRVVWHGFLEEGVDLSLARIDDAIVTPCCVCMVDATGERAIIIVPGAGRSEEIGLELTPAVVYALKKTRLVYTVPREQSWFEDMASVVHASAGVIMVDVESWQEVRDTELAAILAVSDIVSCNRGGLAKASGMPDPEMGARRLLARGSRTRIVVVTLGSEGALAVTSDGACVHASGYHEIDVLDTTGAGDCFNAAFAYSFLRSSHMGIQYILDFANAAASLSVEGLGARGCLPRLIDVERRMSHKGRGG